MSKVTASRIEELKSFPGIDVIDEDGFLITIPSALLEEWLVEEIRPRVARRVATTEESNADDRA